MKLNQAIGFIGSGQMARALAGGFVRAGLVEADRLLAADPLPAARDAFAEAAPGARISADNGSVAGAADVLFLAVKPQLMPDVLAGLRGKVDERHLVISIAAGVPLDTIAAALGEGPRLVRVMPNTPCLIGRSASAFCRGAEVTDDDARLVRDLLESVGRAFELPERLMDAATGLSGSGPALVYVIIEALSDGGVLMGLPRDVATQLAAQTVAGAAEMVLASGEHPGSLKDRVASPGGTTIAGLKALEDGGVRAALIAAVEAAARRSVELGKADEADT